VVAAVIIDEGGWVLPWGVNTFFGGFKCTCVWEKQNEEEVEGYWCWILTVRSLGSGCYWLELLVFMMVGSMEIERDEEMGLFLWFSEDKMMVGCFFYLTGGGGWNGLRGAGFKG